MSMYKMAAVGEKDSILGFKSLGVDIFPVKDKEDAGEALDSVVKEKYAIVFITEAVAQNVLSKIEELHKKQLPSVVMIPNNQGTLNLGMRQIKKNAEKAIGADILFGKEGR